MWFFQVMPLSRSIQKNFVLFIPITALFRCSIWYDSVWCWHAVNFIILVFSMFKANPFAVNHPIMQSKALISSVFNFPSFLEINKTLVTSAYIVGLSPRWSPYGRSFLYIIQSSGHRIDPWQTPLVIVSHLQDIPNSRLCEGIITCCFLFSR